MVALPANEGYLVQSEQHQLQSQGHRESSRSTWSKEFQRIQHNIGFLKHSTSIWDLQKLQQQHWIFKTFNTNMGTGSPLGESGNPS